MTCGNLPNHDHITHYVKPTKVRDDGSIDGSIFRQSALDDDGISVNWLEFFDRENESERLREVAMSIQRETSRDGRFAEMNVGDVVGCLVARGCSGQREARPTRGSEWPWSRPIALPDSRSSHPGFRGEQAGSRCNRRLRSSCACTTCAKTTFTGRECPLNAHAHGSKSGLGPI